MFDKAASLHRVDFGDDDFEWVAVSISPFNDYVSYYLQADKDGGRRDGDIINQFGSFHFDDSRSICSKNSLIERGSGDHLVFHDGQFSFEFNEDEDETPNFTVPALRDIFVPKYDQVNNVGRINDTPNIVEANVKEEAMVARPLEYIGTNHDEEFVSIMLGEHNEDEDISKKTGPRLWTSEVNNHAGHPHLATFHESLYFCFG